MPDAPPGTVPPPGSPPSAVDPAPPITIYTITFYPPKGEPVSWDTQEFQRLDNTVELKVLSTGKTVRVVGNFSIIKRGEGQSDWFVKTFDGVVKSRNKAGVIAFLALCWSAIRFFQALVHGVNKAWGTKEYSWWRLPIQNLYGRHRGQRALPRGRHSACP